MIGQFKPCIAVIGEFFSLLNLPCDYSLLKPVLSYLKNYFSCTRSSVLGFEQSLLETENRTRVTSWAWFLEGRNLNVPEGTDYGVRIVYE